MKNKIDKIWMDMFSYGMSNPLKVIEQLTYLFFIRALDDVETISEADDELLGIQGDRIFPSDKQHLRFKNFKELKAEEMHEIIRDEVFPFIKELQADKKSGYAKYMRDAKFEFESPLLTQKVITAISALELNNRDIKGDIYEYMLNRIQSSGDNGQFRTPRHIINMIVRLMKPTLADKIVDPACGTGGFLIGAGGYVKEKYENELHVNPTLAEHFAKEMFTGYDTDQTMLRIAAMNTMLHGMDNANIEYKDSLSKHNGDEDDFTMILANPPFTGSLDHESTASNLTDKVSTKKTELLFLTLFLRILAPGGRCACIVPSGVLFGASKAHIALRKLLIDSNKLEAVISMPSGVFKPYAGVTTAILIFTKTGTGGTNDVWFYDMKADGYTLDDKRAEIDGIGDINDIVARFSDLNEEKNRTRKEQSFMVPACEIIDKKYDLSFNKYCETDYVEEDYSHPTVTIEKFKALEEEILAGIAEMEAMFE